MKTVPAPVTLKVVCTGDDRSDAIRRFCTDVQALQAGIICKPLVKEASGLPGIELAPNILYAGVPSARELEPFLMALAMPEEGISLRETPGWELGEQPLPARMDLYVTVQCPHCPEAVKRLLPLARKSSRIALRIIDAEMFGDLSKAAGVKSVPTLIIDDLYREAGGVDPLEVAAYLRKRSPSSLGASALESMLKEGNAARVARLMAAEGNIFPAFVGLLTHAKWPVRLGAMVALEALTALDRELAEKVIAPLWSRFENSEDPVKGDILYVLGAIGGPQAERLLTATEAGKHAPEVREAARDALDSIRNSGSAGPRQSTTARNAGRDLPPSSSE